MRILTLSLVLSLAAAAIATAQADPEKGIRLVQKLDAENFAEREKAFAELAAYLEQQYQQSAADLAKESKAGDLDWSEVMPQVEERVENSILSALRKAAQKQGAEAEQRVKSIEPHKKELIRRAALLAGLDAPSSLEMELAHMSPGKVSPAAGLT